MTNRLIKAHAAEEKHRYAKNSQPHVYSPQHRCSILYPGADLFQHRTGHLSLEKLCDTHPQHRQKSQSKYYYTHAPQPLCLCSPHKYTSGINLDIGQHCCSCSSESGHSFKISICE